MNLTFSPQALEDYAFWKATDPKTVQRIHRLLKEITRSSHSGVGKPEALKYALHGYWSRRIDAEHRLVHKAVEGGILIAQLRYRYDL